MAHHSYARTAGSRTRTKMFLALGAALAFVISGSSARAQNGTPSATYVRVATSAAETYAQAFYARDVGFYNTAGVAVDVATLATGAAVAAAVLNGSADIGVATMINLANAKAGGVPIVIIAPSTLSTPAAPTSVLCVAKSSAFTKATDFAGQRIAVPALLQTADLGARAWLKAGGQDPAKVQIVEEAFSAMPASLANGTNAGVMLSEPALTRAKQSGAVRCFPEVFAAIAPTFLLAAWFTTKPYADKHPELVRKVAAALTSAGAWANAHQDDSAAIVARVNNVGVDLIRAETRPVYAETLRMDEIQPQLDAGYTFGFLTRRVSAGELLGR